MKKLLSLTLASAMVMSMASFAFAKASEATYPVGSIGTSAYLYDSDASAVDLANSVDSVDYGETLYYPLLNNISYDNSEAIANAQALVDQKQGAYDAAVAALESANGTVEAKTAALEAAVAELAAANAVLTAANAWNNASTEEADAAKAAYEQALAAFSADAIAASDAATAVSDATTFVSTASGAHSTAEGEANTANEQAAAAEQNKETAATELKNAQDALSAIGSSDFKYVYESDAVSGIKIKQDWDMNNKLIDNVEITKKKVTGVTLPQKYIYFLSVSVKDEGNTEAKDISGTIKLRKSGEFDYDDMQLDVNVEIAYAIADSTEITEDLQLFKEGHGFSGDEEEEFTFECDSDSYFTVNTVGQGKLLLAATSDFDSTIASIYPHANLEFFYGSGDSFNRTGTLYLHAEEDSFLYQVNSDGSLSKVNAEYDSYDENFVIRTRTLGKYVISDVELDVKDSVNNGGNNNNGGSVTVPENPATGAIA